MQKLWTTIREFTLKRFLGPALLIGTFSVGTLYHWPFLSWFYFVFFISLFSHAVWKQKAYFSLFPLFAILLVCYFHYHDKNVLFLGLSSLLGLTTIFLSSEEKQTQNTKITEKMDQLEASLKEKNQQFEQEIQKSFADVQEKEEYIESLKRLSQKEKQENELLLQQKEKLAEQVIEAKKIAHDLKIEMEHKSQEKASNELIEELNKLRAEHFQLKMLLEEKPKTQQIDLFSKPATPQLQEERDQIQRKYEKLQRETLALRKILTRDPSEAIDEKLQEKIEELHEARIDLFKIESKLMVLAKENEKLAIENPLQEKALSDYLQLTDNECLRLEEENELLHSIISNWTKAP